jgi:aminopeptidase N
MDSVDGALRGIQQQLRYRSVTTSDVVRCFNSFAGADYALFFDQYLRYPSIPVLQWRPSKEGFISYRWQVDVPGFWMPVKVNPGGVLLQATDQWKEARLPGAPQVDMNAYYIQVRP